MASPAPSGNEPNNTPSDWQKRDSASSSSSNSTTSTMLTTDNCELDWASLAFPMALSVIREESLPESQAEVEARWCSQLGSGWSEMAPWSYWPGGSQGNPPTLSSSSSVLTILRPPRRPQLSGSSPSSPLAMEVSTPSSRRPDASTTLLPLQRCIDTACLMTSTPSS